MKSQPVYNNIAFGQVDIDLKGRNDLPVYITSGEVVENFYSTVQGNLLYRPGFEFLEDNGNNAIYEFVFNSEQSYLLVFDETNIEFWSYTSGGELVKVQSGGSDLQVAHPYGADRFDLNIAQKGDVMYIVHKGAGYAGRKLTRTGAAAFTLATYTITGSSFGGKNPRAVAFYEGRLIYATDTAIHGSKVNDYDILTIGTAETAAFKFEIADLRSNILWLFPGKNSLIAGTKDGIATINGGAVNAPITPVNVDAKVIKSGAYKANPIEKDGYILYISRNQREIYAINYDILTEGFEAALVNRASYDITKGKMEKLVHKKDKRDFVYIHCGNDLLVLNFVPEQNVRSLIKIKSAGVFKDICTVIKPDGDNDLFALILYGSTYCLEVLSDFVEFSKIEDSFTGEANKISDFQNYLRLISEELKLCNHLDNSAIYNGYKDTTITYDPEAGTISSTGTEFVSGDVGRIISYKTITGAEIGIFEITGYNASNSVDVNVLKEPSENTSTGWYLHASLLTGLNHLNGETVAVVGDGGYIGEFTVEDNAIQLPNYYSVLIVGRKYTGFYKSFNYGFNATTAALKVIYKVFIRFNKSAGVKFGTNRYNMLPVQNFSPDGYYDSPPLLMDADEELIYNNDNISVDKRIVIVQDFPLPMQVTAIIPFFKQYSKA